MRHFDQLEPAVRDAVFHRAPQPFGRDSARVVLAQALGATLYVPATRRSLAATVRRQAAQGVRSLVIDLEDAISDDSVDGALTSTGESLRDLHEDPPECLLFVRVRSPDQVGLLTDQLGPALAVVSGFVLPKFSVAGGAGYLQAVADADEKSENPIYAMPVIETAQALYRESRDVELAGIRELLQRHAPRVLAIRIGATDLCGLFGIRRDRDLSIYDVGIAADLITQVVNHLGRVDGTGFPVSAPVWEYFANHERILRPQLRQTPFDERQAAGLRRELLSRDLDGLMREIMLDRANGLTGKTVIHPLHVAPVHALAVVSLEEYQDALDVLHPASSVGGVRPSGFGNKMNEIRPHRIWAERILQRADAFGVARHGISHVDILNVQRAAG